MNRHLPPHNFRTMEELQQFLDKVTEEKNNLPIDDFEGYSPVEMHNILYCPFEDGSVVSLRELPSEEYKHSPIYMTMKALIAIIVREGQVKLTANGYLPPKYVTELYAMGYLKEDHIEKGYIRLEKEADSDVISIARMILESAKVCTKRKSVLTISKKGMALLNNDAQLFRLLFTTFTNRFRWAYLDEYGIEDTGQFGVAYSCILLDKYGDREQPHTFYVRKYFKAYPSLMEGYSAPAIGTLEEYFTHCYSLRTIDRFFYYWGFIDMRVSQPYGKLTGIVNTPFFKKVMECRSPKCKK